MNRENEKAMFAGKKKSGLTKEQVGLDSKKQSKINRDNSFIEIWKTSTFDGKPMISVINYRDGSMTDYVLQKKSDLPKGDINGYIDTDEYLKRAGGFKRMRQIEDILDNES